MIKLELLFEDGRSDCVHIELPVKIGRCKNSDLALKAWRVAKNHAVLEARNAGLFIRDLGALAGTFVNGNRISEYGPLSADDEIIIGPCLMKIALPEQSNQAMQTTDAIKPQQSQVLNTHSSETISEQQKILALHRRRLHNKLLEALDLRRRNITSMSDQALRSEARLALAGIIETDDALPPDICHASLLNEVVNEAVGLGLLEPLLADSKVTEIMVNCHDEIFVESGGQIQPFTGTFSSEQAVLGIIDRIVSPLGRRIDESSPMVDARLQDGSRVNAIIPPIALKGASITIRKFPANRPDMADLLKVGALDHNMAAFLQACVVQRKNIVVSGGTGSGKTTLLNILSNCIPAGERIVTIEDAAELQLSHMHLVALEARPPNLEGKGAISIRDLVRNSLRMRPDRIVVGECRGAEAFDMLAAMNTGHEGSLTTLHANSPRDALSRLETMILMAGMDLPLEAIREHVASAIDFIVQQARMSSGHRVITSIVQITGKESGRIQLQELFTYKPGPPALFEGTGILPDGMVMQANELNISMFNQSTSLTDRSTTWAG